MQKPASPVSPAAFDDRTFVRIPHLLWERTKEKLEVVNPAYQTRVEVPERVWEGLKVVGEPATLAQFLQRWNIDAELLQRLVTDWVLLPADEVDFLKGGYVAPAGQPIGRPCAIRDLAKARPGTIAVFGVPTDFTAGGDPGTRWGPLEIRRMMRAQGPRDWTAVAPSLLDLEFRRKHDTRELRVLDLGDIFHAPGEDIWTLGKRIEKLGAELVSQKLLPVMIGGDHALSWFSIKAALDRLPSMGIIHFDAHHDMSALPDGDLDHSNPFCFAAQKTNLRYLRQLGLRTHEYHRPGTVPLVDSRITYFSGRELQRMEPAAVFAGLPRDVPVYVSFDCDCLSLAIAPDTGTKLPGGLDFYQALDLLDYVAQNFQLVGVDFMEVASSALRVNLAARHVAKLLAHVLLSRAPFEAMGSHLYQFGEGV